MTKELVFISGKGFDGVPKTGLFEIVTTYSSRKFTRLNEALRYYNGLNEDKAIWQHEPSQLLQCHAFVNESFDYA